MFRLSMCMRSAHAALVLFVGVNALSSVAVAAPRCAVTLAEALRTVGGARVGQLATSKMSGVLELPGVTGTFSSLVDLRTGRYFDRKQYGPVTQSEGDDGHGHWVSDVPGDVRTEDNPVPAATAAAERFDRSLAYWFTDRMGGAIRCEREVEDNRVRFAIYRVEPQGGDAFALWINTRTKRVERRVQKQGPVETVTRYADFRRVDGVLAPFLIETESSDTHVPMRLRVQRREFTRNPDEAGLARPPVALADYAFAGGQHSTTVPFKEYNNHPFVPVTFNGHGPYYVILDSGGGNVISPQLAKEFGLTIEGRLGVTGTGDDSAALSLTHLDTLTVGGVTLRDQLFYVIDLDPPGVDGVPIVGLLGYEVLRRLVTRFDYDRHEVTLSEPSSFRDAGAGVVIPFTFYDSHPHVTASLDGEEGQFLVDTGSRWGVSINGPFADAHKIGAREASPFITVTGWGVGGPVRGQVMRGGVLQIGDLTVKEPLVAVEHSKGGTSAHPVFAGIIGSGLLRLYNVTFDYARQRMIVEPRVRPLVENDYDRSGMWINPSKDGFSVYDVVAGGPAEQVGIRTGDQIVSLADRAVSDWIAPDLRRFLRTQPVGTRVAVEVLRDGKRHAFVLELRNLVPAPKGS